MSADAAVDQTDARRPKAFIAGAMVVTMTSKFPPGAIHRCFGYRGWIPLHWDGNRNYLGIDLDPGPRGVVGQVINCGGDEHSKYVLATS